MLSKLTFGNKGPTNNGNNNKSSIPGPKQRLSASGSTHNNHNNNNNIGLGSNQFVGNNNCATSSIGKTAQGSSRSNSPASHSFIPQPSLSSTPSASTTTGKAIIITPRAPSVSSSIPQIPGSILNGKINVTLRNKNNTAVSAVQTAAGQQSMLDKIKIFRSGQQSQVQNTNDNQQLNAKSASIPAPAPAPAVNSNNNNNNNNNINKRASSSSGFSSAKSDSSASLCGVGSGDINTSLIVNNKTKPSITKSGKNSNVINGKGKKCSDETTINNCCDNNNPNKTSVNSTNNNSNSSGKTGLIPVRRSIPPPRSRPTSTIIESGTIPSSIPTTSMATNSSSSSNITIPKPTACVKGTSKMIFNCHENYTNHSVGKLNMQDNHDTQKINFTKQHQATSATLASSMSTATTTTTNSAINKSAIKSELSIAMVSPIMVRERKESLGIKESDEQKLIKEKKDQQTDKYLNDVPSTSSSSCLSPKKQSNSDLQQIDSASSHGEESASNSDVDTTLINIKPMEPLMDRTSQFAFLRGTNNSTTGNHNINSKFPNNYSSIENGYQSDCTLLNNSKSGLRRGSGTSPQHHNGYPNQCNTELCHSESSGIIYTPQMPKSQISASKVEFMGLSAHRHYQHENRHQDADSATNLFHNLNHNNQQKHLNCHNANVISSPLRQFCLDDSSSLSSDPGMISGTDISGTTTSSMSSSNGGGESIGFYNMSKSNMKNSSSTSTNHNHNKSLPSSCSRQKSTKKTDSSMQTESISALSSAAAFKRYLHDHHLIMKVNNTVAPRNGVNNAVDEGTKSLDRLEARNVSSSNNKRIINGIKYTDRRDSSESLKAKIKHDLNFVSNKRPLSSPNSSRINVTTIPGPASKQYSSGHRHHGKIKVPGSTQTDVAHSDTEYIQQKSSFGSKYSSYLSSPIHKRDNSLRMSSYADIGTFNNHENSHLSMSSHNNPISPWLQRHASSIQRNALTEAESMESLNGPLSLDSGNYFLSKQSRPSSASIRLRDSSSSLSTQPSQSSQSQSKSQTNNTSQLSRSNSIRNGNNNKSVEPLSQPTSPTRFISPSLLFPNSNSNQIHGQSTCLTSTPTRTTAGSGVQFKPITKDEDEIHGSSLSLVSTGSIFSTTEEKQTHEIRRLRRELEQSNEKVITLNNQLATNAHMVAAFEQSLSSMTSRLQQLTASTEQKDTELDRLRSTIETLKQHGITQQQHDNEKHSTYGSRIVHRDLQRNQSTESVSSTSSGGEGSNSKSKKKSKNKVAVNNNSNNNHSSSSWLRSSFTRAFKKNKSKRGSGSDAETAGNGIFNDLDSNSVPNSPLMSARSFHSPSHANDDSNHNDDCNETEVVRELKRQLREKEMALTDIRLESLTSAHQLENLKEIVNRMRAEMMTLKQDNERLQRLATNKSLDSSQNSIISNNGVAMSNGHLDDMQISENLEVESMTNALLCEGGKRAIVGCGTHIIACLIVTPKTKWEQLDLMIKKCFKDHLNRIDPGSGLGLNLDSLACYQVGSERIERFITTTPNEPNNSPNSPSSIKSSFVNGSPVPELLPYGYLVNENHISLQFKSASDSLVFDTLIPKSIIQKFLGLLNEHKRIILCGPSGTGKTFLAHKLAEYLSIKCATEGASPGIPIDCCPDGSIATFSVDHKSSKELRAYLNNIAEQCESRSSPHHLPKVIILDNLHHIDSISSVFNGILSVKSSKYPYIIGTMNQATCSTTNLQTQHNFRWVLCANHTEPVKGLLSRYLKRKLSEVEAKNACNNLPNNNELAKIVDWIPKIWNHLNNFLETHSSSDATIGPRLFLSCPIDVSASQVWFTDLWNYSVVPYVTETTREGIQLYGRRSQFIDPSDWVLETYPWVSSSDKLQDLLRIRAEEVDYNCDLRSDLKNNENGNSNDPLLNMLMRLQEAANYSSQSIKSAGNQESITNSGSES